MALLDEEDDILGGIDENEIVHYDDEPESVSNLRHFDGDPLQQYTQFFEFPYTKKEELDQDITAAHTATTKAYEAMAIRRRAIGAAYFRKGYKIAGYKSVEELAMKCFHLGRKTFYKTARNAGMERQLAKMSEISHILELNLRDSFFEMLNRYPEFHHIRIVNEMAKRRIPLKGKQLSDFCEELGIQRKAGGDRIVSHTPADSGIEDKAVQTVMQFSAETQDSAWKYARAYSQATGQIMTLDQYVQTACAAFYLHTTKRK